ncbi:MAG: alpha/beta hydrolase, partial [Thermomicrobiales bacterium]|nr:alpha/beta hydrolase [Thermomicrobiales bacterium]
SFVVLVSPSEESRPDPIVYLSGGPGESTLSGIGGYATIFQELRQDRDIILFDQRGTHFSSPLRCSTFALDSSIAQQLGTPEADDDDNDDSTFGPLPDAATLMDQARAAVAENTQRCIDDLTATGVDLSQYNSHASANDMIALMHALEVDQFNLYGISYGTRLALAIMRDHPNAGIRSVVLDSTFPPEINGFERYPAEIHEVVLQVFAACYRDNACNTAYPHLKERFKPLLETLRTTPVIASTGDPIADEDLVEIVKLVSKNAELGIAIPVMIEQLEQGDTTAIEAVASGTFFSDEADDATPEAAGVSDEAPGTPDVSVEPAAVPGADEADAFMAALGESLATAPISRRSDVLFHLALLDNGPHTVDALEQFVTRAFPGDDEANDRETLTQLIDSMDADGIAQVFAAAASLSSLIDLQTLGLSNEVFNSVECNEEIPFENFAVTVETANNLEIPQIAYSEVQTIAQQFATCEIWNSGTAEPIEAEPVVSDIPTLIFAGTYDYQTPPTWNKSAFVGLQNATFVQFPATNHGVIVGQNACASAITGSFFDNPDALPDILCSDESRPVWILPDGSVTQPN